MLDDHPLTKDEAAFVARFMYEVLHFDSPVDDTTSRWFRELGIRQPALVNFSSAMELCGFELLKDAIFGPEPKVPKSSPWKSRENFIARDAVIQIWLADQNLPSHCIDPFIGS